MNGIENTKVVNMKNRFKPTTIIYITITLFNIFLTIPYLLAVYYNHVDAFPATSISGTGHNMPDCIIFRFAAIPSCFFLAFSSYLQYAHMSNIVRRITTQKKACILIFLLGLAGAVCFSFSTSLMSDYKMNHKLHIRFAGLLFIFFFLQQIVQVIQWFAIRHASEHQDQFISNKSFYTKIVIVLIGLAALFISAYGQKFNNFGLGYNAGNICEWVGAQLIGISFFTSAWDFNGIVLSNKYVKLE